MTHAEPEEFRQQVRAWCAEHIPADWRRAQTGVDDDEFVRFQKAWFAVLHTAGYGCRTGPASGAAECR